MKIKPFELSVLYVIVRFFVGMFVGIIGGVLGNIWIMGLVIPIVLSAMLGLKFEFGTVQTDNKLPRVMEPRRNLSKAS